MVSLGEETDNNSKQTVFKIILYLRELVKRNKNLLCLDRLRLREAKLP